MFKSSNMIVAGVVGATGLTVLSSLLTGSLSMRPILGGFVIGAILLTVGLVSTPVAAALAFLLLLTSIMVNAPTVLQKAGL